MTDLSERVDQVIERVVASTGYPEDEVRRVVEIQVAAGKAGKDIRDEALRAHVERIGAVLGGDFAAAFGAVLGICDCPPGECAEGRAGEGTEGPSPASEGDLEVAVYADETDRPIVRGGAVHVPADGTSISPGEASGAQWIEGGMFIPDGAAAT